MSDTITDWHLLGSIESLFPEPAADDNSENSDNSENDERPAGCPSRACHSLKVGGVQVALFNVEGRVYAIDDRCTHGNAFLSEGELDGFEVECPMHAGVFDVRTGAVLGPPATRAARCHSVRVEDGAVSIRLTPRT